LEPVGACGFHIEASREAGGAPALVLPDLVTCPDCLREILDPRDRRYGYPFTNCTSCGPRFSIIEGMPYDRERTSMRGFVMCAACRREFEDPEDRRHHAQPIACPECGPQLRLCTPDGGVLVEKAAALDEAARALRQGKIVAVKGLGGYQLLVRAGDQAAVTRLRERKRRGEKPFALMFADLDQVAAVCHLSEDERTVLGSPAGPIVLLRRRGKRGVCAAVAPGNPMLGVMLPTTPLHHLLLRAVGGAVVATSGNLSEEPICTDDAEALHRLGGMADLFLAHDRPIVRHVDDSIVRVLLGREMVLRRARGYAPLPVPVIRGRGDGGGPVVLAHGADLKNSVAVSVGDHVVLGQHIGDLGNEASLLAHERAAVDLPHLHGVRPEVHAVDLHPAYQSRRAGVEAVEAGKGALCEVQHHHAHALACMAENAVPAPALAVVWDGTGYGTDATIWGGEFLLEEEGGRWRRYAHLRTFPLPGGDAAAREPRRSALGVLDELGGQADGMLDQAFTPGERVPLAAAMRRGVNTVRTSSAGRLVDAVASLLGVRHRCQFEAQAAMELEFLADGAGRSGDGGGALFALDAPPRDGEPAILDWGPCIRGIVNDRLAGFPVEHLSARFHAAMVEGIVQVARHWGGERVLLSGGCFQNKRLLEGAVHALRAAGFRPFWHQRVPPGDGGVALGQVLASRSESA